MESSDNASLAAEVARLRQLGSDDAVFEVKSAVQKLPKSVWVSISAFANTSGGTLILGLDESEGFTPASGFQPGRIIDQLTAGLREGHGARISPVPPYEIRTETIAGSPVVLVDIFPLRPLPNVQLPCYVVSQGIKHGSYKRVHDQDQRLSPYEIHILENLKQPTEIDIQAVPGTTIDDLATDRAVAVLDAL
ncbi:MAG: AAA family ATPase, partial [Actinomycetales bacterium]